MNLRNPRAEVSRLNRVSRSFSTSGNDVDGRLTMYAAETLAPFFTGRTALEVGAADGRMTRVLIERFDRVTVVEGSPTYCATLRRRFKTSLTVHCALVEEYAADGQFDTVLLAHLLEHVVDPLIVLRRVAAWVSPRGRLLVAVPNAHSIHRLAAVKMGLLERPDSFSPRDRQLGHRRVYTPTLLRSHVRRAGYEIVATGGIFFKPLSNQQMERWFSDEMMDGFCRLGEDFPAYAAEIYAVCRPGRGRRGR